MVSVGLPILLHEAFGVPPRNAVAVAVLIAFFMYFFSLRRLVFSSDRGAGRDLLIFTLSSLAFRAAEYLSFLGLSVLLHVYYVLSLVIVLSLSTLAKFLWYRHVMHRPAAEREAQGAVCEHS
jgi:putative flippase GtrA